MSAETVEVDGRDLAISNGDKLFFADRGITKRQLIDYYLAVGEGALTGCFDRPSVLKRYPNGAAGPYFFQKRAPVGDAGFLRTTTVQFPSGRSADLLVIDSLAALIWSVNLGCIDINPWPVRSGDTDHPDELRVDLDPTPGVPFDEVRAVAACVREVDVYKRQIFRSPHGRHAGRRQRQQLSGRGHRKMCIRDRCRSPA